MLNSETTKYQLDEYNYNLSARAYLFIPILAIFFNFSVVGRAAETHGSTTLGAGQVYRFMLNNSATAGVMSYTILSSNGKISVYVLTLADYAKLVDGENFLYYTSYSHLSVQQAFLDPTAFDFDEKVVIAILSVNLLESTVITYDVKIAVTPNDINRKFGIPGIIGITGTGVLLLVLVGFGIRRCWCQREQTHVDVTGGIPPMSSSQFHLPPLQGVQLESLQ